MEDYYKVLGVEENATQEEIKKAYRKLSLKFHPDKNNGDEFFENMFREVQEAYDVVGDVNERRKYDAKRSGRSNSSSSNTRRNTTYSQRQTRGNYNNQPRIEILRANKAFFTDGDEVTFQWETRNANHVVLEPFGVVAPSGTKTYRLNNFNHDQLIVKLKATNTNLRTFTEQRLVLDNRSYQGSRQRNVYRQPSGNVRRFRFGGGIIFKIIRFIIIINIIMFLLSMFFG